MSHKTGGWPIGTSRLSLCTDPPLRGWLAADRQKIVRNPRKNPKKLPRKIENTGRFVLVN